MISPYAFSLNETTQKIFLHAIDGQFENSSSNDLKLTSSAEMLDESNVKFLLSLDGEENFNDISTEINSEGEESLRDSYADIKAEVFEPESPKLKLSNFLNGDYSICKTEIEKIKAETVKGLRLHQMQIYNKMMTMQQMMRNNQGMGNFGNSFNLPSNFLDIKSK